MQVVWGILRARQRPFLLITPTSTVKYFSLFCAMSVASSHDKDLNRWLLIHTRWHVAQPAVIPTQLLVEIALHPPNGFLSKVGIARIGVVTAHPHMCPRPHDQALVALILRCHRRKILHHRRRIGVKPA